MAENIKISPSYDVYKLTKPVTIDTYIDIYEDRLRYWIIKPAKILTTYEHGGFAICYLLASYFESYVVYLKGKDSKNNVEKYFTEGFHSVFQDLLDNNFNPKQIGQINSIMYKNFRCGLYHTGFTKGQITLCQLDTPINVVLILDDLNKHYEIHQIQIDATKMIDAIENHSNNYVSKLREKNNIDLRSNFHKSFINLYA